MKQLDSFKHKYLEEIIGAYSILFQKIMTAVGIIGAWNDFIVQNFEKFSIRDILLETFQKSRLHIDKELYRTSK